MRVIGVIVICLCALVLSAAPGLSPWPTRVSELRLLLAGKQLSELEKAIVGAQERFERGQAGEDEPWATMYVFLDSDEPTSAALSEWVAQAPGSYAALAARGLYYEGTGWSASGVRRTSNPTAWERRTMRALHALAEVDCTKALEIEPALVACHVSLINIAKGRHDVDLTARRYEAARQALPASVLITTARLESLTPRWGGSYEQMESFLAALPPEVLAQPGGRALLGHVKEDQAWVAAIEGNYTAAMGLYTEAIAKGGGAAAYYAGRGVNAMRLGRDLEALSDFDRAIAMSPRGWPYSEAKLGPLVLSRARLRHAQGQHAGAQADIRDGLALNPRSEFGWKLARTILPTR
jgi:tetratricopeptide (TPR) repeat protein